MINIIIAGSRDFDNFDLVESTLCSYVSDYNDIAIISGGARGADTVGEHFAIRHNVKLIRMPANWKKYGKAAGCKRNEDMAIYSKTNGMGVLFAFWNGRSKGTLNMISVAKRHGLEVHVISTSADNPSDQRRQFVVNRLSVRPAVLS